jgi:LysM repeat protein
MATHVVKTGDTLSTIADQFNTTVAALVSANGIVDPNRITIGDHLIIPGNGADDVHDDGSLRAKLQRVVDHGHAEGWKPYSGPIVGEPEASRWGTPGYDCSSFVASMYRQVLGIELAGFTDTIAGQTDDIPTNEALPGDIILYRYHDPDQPGVNFPHTGLWLDGVSMLDCQCTGIPDLHHPGLGVHPVFNRPFEIHRARGISDKEDPAMIAELQQQVAALQAQLADERSWGSAILSNVIVPATDQLDTALAETALSRDAVSAVRDLLAANGGRGQ